MKGSWCFSDFELGFWGFEGKDKGLRERTMEGCLLTGAGRNWQGWSDKVGGLSLSWCKCSQNGYFLHFSKEIMKWMDKIWFVGQRMKLGHPLGSR